MGLDFVFKYLRKKKEISLSLLQKYGLNDEDIKELTDNNILVENENNQYEIGDLYELFMYGRYQLELKNYTAANNIFICCYEKNRNDFLANYQLFYRSLLQKNEKNVFKHFDVVYKHLKENGRSADANYYLYLLGNIYGVGNKYKTDFDNIEEKDILLDDVDASSMYDNLFRKEIFNNSYYKVNTMFDEKFDYVDKDNTTFECALEKELVLKWLFKNRNFNKMLVLYLNESKIEEVKDLLDKEDENRFLTKTNQYLLKVINQYLTIRKTKVIPKVKYDGDDVFAAIDGNNFSLAMKLIAKYQETYNIEKSNYLYLMLEKVEDLINNIEMNQNKDDLYERIKPLIDFLEEVRSKDKNNSNSNSNSLSLDEKKSLDSKIRDLHNGKCAFLLEPMSKEKRDLVYDYIASKPSCDDIVIFSIGNENEKRLVLRYKPYIKEYISITDLAYEAKRCYIRQDYENAKEKYELLLKVGKPRDITYGRYGMTLLKLHKKKEALDYLKIATIMSKENGGELDYTKIIEGIEYPINYEDRKANVVMDEEEFTHSTSGVDDNLINDIIGLAQDGDISLLDACKKLNISEVDTNYIKLLYARDLYYLDRVKEADTYLKQVERSKAKDEKVKKLYKEILVDKKYYKNRLDDDKSQIVFKKII